jgi:hypothetical protein
MGRPQKSGAVWEQLASGLPRALVYDVHYDYTYDLITAATLGRGVWALKNFIRPGGWKGISICPACETGREGAGNTSETLPSGAAVLTYQRALGPSARSTLLFTEGEVFC